MKKILSILLLMVSLQAAAQKSSKAATQKPPQSATSKKANDTFSVYFDLDVAELNSRARDHLDSLLYLEKIKPGVSISIIGYADYLNTDEYNLILSRTRATNVKTYLVQNGIDDKAIKLLTGKGEVKRKDTLGKTKGVPSDRRVDVVMEYQKPPKTSGDVVIKMKPGEKLEIPPSSSDPGFDIAQVPKGKTFILKNIYFPMGRHIPRQTSYPDLEKLLKAMQDNAAMIIQIEGHVCCVTDVPDAYDMDSHQLNLSVNRARFIYEYLMANGIPQRRLTYIGFGRSRPIIADEQTEEEASVNRRVEIRIVDK